MQKNTSMSMENEKKDYPSRGSMIIGGAIFILGFLSPLSIPLLIGLKLPEETTAVISSLLVFGIPEIAMLLAVAIMGKPGFDFMKRRLFALFGKVAPPDSVGPVRYALGLVLFVTPLLIAFLTPYLRYFHLIELEREFFLFIGGDLLLIISIFVLGGDFWDKIRGLFIRTAKITAWK